LNRGLAETRGRYVARQDAAGGDAGRPMPVSSRPASTRCSSSKRSSTAVSTSRSAASAPPTTSWPRPA